MKTILMSIKKKWWNLILSGKKTIEIRKTAPKEIDFPVTVVCYVSGLGICGSFVCEYITKSNLYNHLAERSCLTPEELNRYANGRFKHGSKELFGWAIREGSPVQFDEIFPVTTAGVKRPPQSWGYIPAYFANKVSYSFDNEIYGCTYENSEQAIRDALKDIESWGYNVPEKLYVGKCEFFKPSLYGMAWDIIESVQCQAYDEGFDDYASEYMDGIDKEQREELESELEEVFQNWIERNNLYPSFYHVRAWDEYRYNRNTKKFELILPFEGSEEE